jgi:HSP20 family protein
MSSFITRFDPFRDLAQLQDRVNRIFQESAAGREEGFKSASFVPPVDIFEDEHDIVLKLEVPGVDQKDLDIRIENNTITIRGERKFESETKEENYHRVERRYGSFQRSFGLPADSEPGSGDRRLRKRCPEGDTGKARRGEAEADQSQRRFGAEEHRIPWR